ncbi:MAG: CHAT domain-containing protein, partial [Candidatus Lokiarchaeota archaeon]|nr:CHAT domain-containing protein [Candidatus Lokiarchaeota archaeon]
IYYKWKKYDRAVKTLKKCIQIVEKQKNFKLEARINLLIGKILYFRENFYDAKYYFNQAFNLSYSKINDFKGCIIAKNYLARIFYFQGNSNEALNEFKVSYRILKNIQCRNNIEISDATLNKLSFIIIINIVKIKIKSYEKNQDNRILINILGYLEFLKFFRARNFYKSKIEISNSYLSKWNKLSPKLDEIKKDITILDTKFKESIYKDEKDKIEKNRRNKIENFLSIRDKIWNKSIDGVYSFPDDINQIMDRFFEVIESENKKWLILYFLYSPIDEKMIFFTIDPFRRKISYSFRYYSYEKIKKIIEKQNKINKLKGKKNSELNPLIEDFSSQLFDLLPDQVKEILISNQNEYSNLTIIPHQFLFDFPWEIMKIKNKNTYLKFNVSRHYCIDWLRTDIEKDRKKGARKNSIFYIANPDHGTELELPHSENEFLSLKSKLSGDFKFYELNYMEATIENYAKFINKRKFSILHHGGNLLIDENPQKSKLKLFRHDFITPDHHIKYSFKINPLIVISNIEYQNESVDSYKILYFLRSFMLSGAAGMIYSITSGKKTDKTKFYLKIYESLAKKEPVIKCFSKALKNLEESDLPIRYKHWIYIGDPFFEL